MARGVKLLLARMVCVCGTSMSMALVPDADAQVVKPVAQLVDDDGERFDQLGTFVDVAGTTVIAMEGSLSQAIHQPTGEAHLFDAVSGEQLGTLTPLDEFGVPVEGEEAFAAGVSIEGDTAIVRTAAASYVFDAATGEQLRILEPSLGANARNLTVNVNAVDHNDRFAIVGNVFGISSSHADVFDIQSGEHLFQLTANDQPVVFSQFGSSVAVSGALAAVSDPRGGSYSIEVAPGEFERITVEPSVYLFDLDTGDMRLQLALDSPTVLFGEAVAMDDGVVLVGSPASTVRGQSGFGAAYLFDTETGELLHTLEPDIPFKRFGRAVALDDGIAVIAANEASSASGNSNVAYVFDVETGDLITKLSGADSNGYSGRIAFASDISVSDGVIAIGAADDNAVERGVSWSGAVYTFAVIPEPNSSVLLFAALGALSTGRRRW